MIKTIIFYNRHIFYTPFFGKKWIKYTIYTKVQERKNIFMKLNRFYFIKTPTYLP